jgi:hypothetical protein
MERSVEPHRYQGSDVWAPVGTYCRYPAELSSFEYFQHRRPGGGSGAGIAETLIELDCRVIHRRSPRRCLILVGLVSPERAGRGASAVVLHNLGRWLRALWPPPLCRLLGRGWLEVAGGPSGSDADDDDDQTGNHRGGGAGVADRCTARERADRGDRTDEVERGQGGRCAGGPGDQGAGGVGVGEPAAAERAYRGGQSVGQQAPKNNVARTSLVLPRPSAGCPTLACLVRTC